MTEIDLTDEYVDVIVRGDIERGITDDKPIFIDLDVFTLFVTKYTPRSKEDVEDWLGQNVVLKRHPFTSNRIRLYETLNADATKEIERLLNIVSPYELHVTEAHLNHVTNDIEIVYDDYKLGEISMKGLLSL
jgi:hypothetical protein